jgi:hypothetical protein
MDQNQRGHPLDQSPEDWYARRVQLSAGKNLYRWLLHRV